MSESAERLNRTLSGKVLNDTEAVVQVFGRRVLFVSCAIFHEDGHVVCSQYYYLFWSSLFKF